MYVINKFIQTDFVIKAGTMQEEQSFSSSVEELKLHAHRDS